MALPATKNINYYQGDTYTFVIYPKVSNGQAMALLDNNDDPYLAWFFIDTNRTIEDPSLAIEGYVSVSTSESKLVCQITPTVGRTLVPGTAYVYEVKIKNQETGEVYTLVTGNLSVTGAVDLV